MLQDTEQRISDAEGDVDSEIKASRLGLLNLILRKNNGFGTMSTVPRSDPVGSLVEMH
jgi:hypothetical protein